MSEEQDVVEEAFVSEASAEQQAEAEKMGWIPATRYKGPKEKFVDAVEYIERGEKVLPIIKEHNKRLQTQIAHMSAQQQSTAVALADAQKAIAEMEERHTVATQKAVEKARVELKTQLAAASEAGDHVGVAEITDQLTKMTSDESEKKEARAATPPPFVKPPDQIGWEADNPWFGKDRKRTALALAHAQELREQGDTTSGRAFFDKLSEEVDKVMAPKELEQRFDKVGGARNGGSSDDRPASRNGYSSLPADAKRACDDDAKRFVGPGKQYKDLVSWRNRYAELYNGT